MTVTKNLEVDNNIIPFIPESDFYFSRGVIAYRKRKFDLALKWIKKAAEKTPSNPLFQCQLSIVYTEVGSYHDANQILTRVLSEQGESYMDCYYLIANNYAHLGLLQDAKKYANIYLEKAPSGDFIEEANELIELLEIGIEEEKEDGDDDWILEEEDEILIYQETAFSHIERKEWEQAILVLEEMLTLYPSYQAANHEYHYALFFSGKEKEAIKHEEELLEESPASLSGYMNLAIFYKHSNQFTKFGEMLQILDNIYPIHEQQKLRLATTFAHIGQYETSYQRFRSLNRSVLKGHAMYFYWYSMACFKLQKFEKAEELWQAGCYQHKWLEKKKRPWLDEEIIH